MENKFNLTSPSKDLNKNKLTCSIHLHHLNHQANLPEVKIKPSQYEVNLLLKECSEKKFKCQSYLEYEKK